VKLPFRLTVRVRLALLLAALVVATGVVLLPTSYFLVRVNVIGALASALAAGLRHGGASSVPPPGGAGAQTEVTHSVVRDLLSTLLGQYGVILAALVVIAGAVAWLGAGRMLRPLRQITDTARRITGEDLHERLALGGPADELTELGDTFDAMLARLESAFAAQQLFAANAAHELRTPLAVMRAELDLLLTGPQPSPAEARDAAARLRRTVLGSERTLERLLTLTRGMRACGDPELLGELAGNLIGNAVKYNCPHGWIAVDTRTDGDHVVLEVSNSGQPIADEDLAALLEPFRRASQQRTGNSSGLGLSIVRAVVAAHDGELGLRALAGGGLAVRVSLPAAPARRGG